MGAGRFVKQAQVSDMGLPLHTHFRNCERSREAPTKWGLKKGLCRARRRLDKEIIELSLEDSEDTFEVTVQE